MKRSRLFSLLLILSLVSALCVSPACASSDAALQTVSFPATGVEIDLPADIDGLLYITRDPSRRRNAASFPNRWPPSRKRIMP